MTLTIQSLPERWQQRIDSDEQVLWCGKTRPSAWNVDTVLCSFVGVALCALTGFTAYHLSGVERGAVFFWVIATLFVFLPGGVGLGLSLSPLWHWLRTRSQVWVITNRRVLRFLGPFMREWKGKNLLDEPEWLFLDDEGRDFAFGRHGSKRDFIESVSQEDSAWVESALVRLANTRRAAGDRI